MAAAIESTSMETTEPKQATTVYYPFYSTICQVCSASVGIKRCSKCRLMPYCSSEHQHEDWPHHKKICNAIALSNERISYLIETQQDLNNYKVALKLAWQITLKRDLTPYENTIYLNIRYCKVCYQKICPFDCQICLCAAYCSEEHKKSDLKHMDQCKTLYLCRISDLNQIQYNLSNISLTNVPLSNIDDLIDKTSAVDLERIIAGHLLSPFGTILFALDVLQVSCENLFIHIIGALNESKHNWTLLAIQIFIYYPECVSIDITFIGPDAVPQEPIQYEIDSKLLSLKTYQSLYHEVELNLPHLSIALNCGFHENYNWWPTLPYIVRTPFVITAYLYEEIIQDKNCILQCVPYLNIVKDCVKNPFASTKPFRNWDSEDHYVYYSNNYIMMCDKLF